jgi:hypothetical protein
MRKLFAFILVALVSGCARQTPTPHGAFVVDQFVAVAMEYQGTHALVGANTYGPTPKEYSCVRGAQAGVAQSDDMMPAGHQLVTTCIHVLFGGPLPKGAALAMPVSGEPFEYLTIGVEYAKSGAFVGAQALHPAPDLKTCMREAREVIDDNYKGGQIEAGNSLLLYCMPVPVIEHNSKDAGGIV